MRLKLEEVIAVESAAQVMGKMLTFEDAGVSRNAEGDE